MIKYFRSLLTIFCFIIFGVGGFIIGSLIFPIVILFTPSHKQRYVLSNIVHFSWILFVNLMSFLKLIKINVVHENALRNLKGTIIVANHPSLIDIVILISLIPNSVCIVKGELARNIFIRSIIKRIYILNNLEPSDFVTLATKILNDKLNIVIFPEGTRTDFSKTEYYLHRGFAQIAIKAKAPILPVKIKAVPLILGKNQKWYDVGEKTSYYTITPLRLIKINASVSSNTHILAKKYADIVKKEFFNI